jgi:hypothetical protein
VSCRRLSWLQMFLMFLDIEDRVYCWPFQMNWDARRKDPLLQIPTMKTKATTWNFINHHCVFLLYVNCDHKEAEDYLLLKWWIYLEEQQSLHEVRGCLSHWCMYVDCCNLYSLLVHLWPTLKQHNIFQTKISETRRFNCKISTEKSQKQSIFFFMNLFCCLTDQHFNFWNENLKVFVMVNCNVSLMIEKYLLRVWNSWYSLMQLSQQDEWNVQLDPFVVVNKTPTQNWIIHFSAASQSQINKKISSQSQFISCNADFER